MNFFNSILDLFFPPLCTSCSTRLYGKEKLLCANCLSTLQWLENRCDICGNIPENGICGYCRKQHFYFDNAFSLFPFNKVVQNLIHNLKYNEITMISGFFSDRFKEYFENIKELPEIDIIVPVPLHKVRKRARGYNQAELLSRKIAELLDVEHLPNLLKRIKYTETQTHLNRIERDANVAAAFSLDRSYDVSKKNILIVDDVFTTGSTVNNISKLLKENKSGKIYILTIAHA